MELVPKRSWASFFSSRLRMTLPLHIDSNLNKKFKFTFITQLTLIFIPVVE